MSKEYEQFRTKLNQKEIFFRYLDLDKEINMLVNKMVVFLHYGDTDQTNEVYQKLEGLLMNE
jgi:oligoendopeptidase F